jgi:hypothetical protein
MIEKDIGHTGQWSNEVKKIDLSAEKPEWVEEPIPQNPLGITEDELRTYWKWQDENPTVRHVPLAAFHAGWGAAAEHFQEALQKYGHHIDVGAGKHCAIYPIERGRPCDCGFSKALGE